jgi:protein-disulfide isomerase-like protein with CxxC motif
MLLQQWQTIAAWTGQTWQDYKAELLRVQGLNVMSIAEYQMATQMGSSHFYSVDLLLL